MSFWTAVVIIVAIIAVTEIIKSRHRARRPGDDDGRLFGIKQEDDSAARREVEDLRERIKVLERIATDGNSLDASETRRISQEIEALRDRQES